MSNIEELLNKLSEHEFEIGKPDIFLKCESAVFIKNHSNSLFYTTSEERAKVFAAIFNDWAQLRRKMSKQN